MFIVVCLLTLVFSARAVAESVKKSELKAAARDYRERFQRLIDDQAHILKAENALFE